MKAALETTKVKMMLPGGPIREASQTSLYSPASTAITRTRTAADSISADAVNATAVPANIPSTTQARVRPRAAYGRPCPYRAHRPPALV